MQNIIRLLVEIVLRSLSLFFGVLLILGTLWAWPYLDSSSRALTWSALVLIAVAVLPSSVLQPKASIVAIILSLALFLFLLILTDSSRSVALLIWVVFLHIGWLVISILKIKRGTPIKRQ